MIKNIKYWFFGCGIALTAMSCDGKLDVDPTQSISETNALATEKDVQVTLIGAYDGMSDGDVYGGGFQFTTELLGDDREVLFGGTFTNMDEIWRKTITTGNSQTQATWLDSYNAINRANNVLSALDKVSAANKNTIEGQARFIRGAIYFQLVKLWGKAWGDGDNSANPGVPLVLTPTRGISDKDNVARASVAQVYAQVIDDLTKAKTLLTDEDSGFATSAAATALLSRVYLMQQDYTKARDAANEVITKSGKSLVSSFASVFLDDENDDEVIWRVIVSDQDGTNSLKTFYASTGNQGRGDVRVQNKHLQLYAPDTLTDARAKFFTAQGSNRLTSKFNQRFTDVIVIRLAEMYLTRAECNFRLATTVGATPLADINTIRSRAGASNLTAANLNLAAILKERKLELAFEGLQLDDVKRTRSSVGTLSWNANTLVVPIPQREIDTNKSLTQNPGY
ncbi:MAG: RagB/SusD family nutrient uptake outer membrane protein [Saprospiraceae bacterium]|nr:RagB/SusD family nutrient uptake outer membrane protein [Saprospiraceae bacterium]